VKPLLNILERRRENGRKPGALYELRGNLEVVVELIPRSTKSTVFFAII
jgi:hypothetical protein